MKEKEIRNKIVKARVTEKERETIKQKAKKYGYKNVSKYLIDAVLFENIMVVETSGQDIVYKAYADSTKEIKKFRKLLVDIRNRTVILNEEDSKILRNAIFTILGNQKKMLQLINEKLDLKSHKENMKEKV